MTSSIYELKQKIIKYVSERGPSLPVHLTKISEMSLTFTSAILSELVADKKLFLSNLRIDSSPLYFIPGQEEKLEFFISSLKEPEIVAFKKLKQNKILSDEKQDPVCRVALRSIRDFAIPLKHKEKLYWKYHLLPDEKATMAISEKNEPLEAIGQERVIGQQIWEDIQKQKVTENIKETFKKQAEEIAKRITPEIIESSPKIVQETEKPSSTNFLKEEANDSVKPNNLISAPQEIAKKKKREYPSKTSKKSSLKDLFLKESEEYIIKKGFEIIKVLKIETTRVIFLVKKDEEILIIFSNRKKLDEKEILRDLKKYNNSNLPVEIFIRGESKRNMKEKIDLLRRIREITKIDDPLIQNDSNPSV